jgi:hypothetical protein
MAEFPEGMAGAKAVGACAGVVEVARVGLAAVASVE